MDERVVDFIENNSTYPCNYCGSCGLWLAFGDGRDLQSMDSLIAKCTEQGCRIVGTKVPAADILGTLVAQEKRLKDQVRRGVECCAEFLCGECPYRHLDHETYKMRCIHRLMSDVAKIWKERDL